MRVLGFDVGIKHLAYCIVENQGTEYNICQPCNHHWNIINIIKEDFKCEFEDCDLAIKKFTIVKGIKHYYCGKHARKMHKELMLLNPLNQYLMDPQSNQKCTSIKSCKAKATTKCNDIYMCQKHTTMFNKTVTKERSLQTHKLLVKDFTVHDLKVKLLESLEIYKELFLYVDYVCIENQPVYSNPTMKALADVIYTWFLVRSTIDKSITHSTIKKVCYFAASNKMKINGKKKELNDQIDASNDTYKKTKALGVEECTKMIKHRQEYINHLQTFKKKDDVCDAYLHASYFIQKEKAKKNFDECLPNSIVFSLRKWGSIMFALEQLKLN